VSTVEFALVVPLLILLLVGILDLARGVSAYVVVSNASREGAQYAMLRPTAAPSDIASSVRARSAPLDATQLTVSASYYDGATFQPWPSSGIPATSPQPSSVPIRIEVTYPWSAVSFLIGQFIGGGTGSTMFRSTSIVDARR
jgi:Flp pilus assembly protein TadG